MQESAERAADAQGLNCFDGQPAPPIVIEGWKQLNTFPQQAWEPFWLLLAPVLMNPDSGTNKELITLFCKEHQVAPESMLAAIGCCELLLKQAAAMDLTQELFQKDLETINVEGSDDLPRFIGQRFPEAMKGLRRQIFEKSLAAHGKVMTGLEWRLDTVRHASTGNRLNTDIVLLTLHYQNGRNKDRITLQLTKEAAQEIKRFSTRLPD